MYTYINIYITFNYICVGAAPNCGENEQYNSCGSSCEPTCQNPNPTICTLVSIASNEKDTLKRYICLNNFVKHFKIKKKFFLCLCQKNTPGID